MSCFMVEKHNKYYFHQKMKIKINKDFLLIILPLDANICGLTSQNL